MPKIVAIFVGKPRLRPKPDFAREPGQWLTTFVKDEVPVPVWLGRESLDGNRVGDPGVHGGAEQAALIYSAEHYPYWRAELGIDEMGPGGFGENLTVSGQNERDVCLGDTYRVGQALVQVSKPRSPCFKISWRWNRADLTELVEENGRHGWYVRVLEEGAVAAGDTVELIERPYPDWTVARTWQAMRHRKRDREEAAALAAVDTLSPNWRQRLLDALERD